MYGDLVNVLYRKLCRSTRYGHRGLRLAENAHVGDIKRFGKDNNHGRVSSTKTLDLLIFDHSLKALRLQ